MEKKNKCYYCDNESVTERRIPVEADVVHDGDNWSVTPLYSMVGLCQEHADYTDDGTMDNINQDYR